MRIVLVYDYFLSNKFVVSYYVVDIDEAGK